MKQALCVLFAAALGAPAFGQEAPTASAEFVNVDGDPAGSATLTETTYGVLIDVTVEGLPAGEHGFHIHALGECVPEDDFASAGDHFEPGGRAHGALAEGGMHAGDMPNQFVQEDGVLRAHVLNPNIALSVGEAMILDEDGAALVVHADPDDYSGQPSGNAGARLACAVIATE